MKTHTVLALGMIVLIAFIFMPMSEVTAVPDEEKKMWVCHNGHSINISVSAGEKHMANHDGDTLGQCQE